MAEFDRRIKQLSSAQRALLVQRLRAIRQQPVQKEDTTARKRLVAYVVPRDDLLAPSDLQNFLEDQLPDYMVPQHVVLMETLPRTPNGKIDRLALPAPDLAFPDLGASYVAPRNEVEAVLAQVWADVLGLEAVGVYDNFFELGGDSILSIQIVSRVHQAGLTLGPNQIFEQQTIAELAAVVGTRAEKQVEEEAVGGSVALTPIQHWFFEHKQVDPQHWNQFIVMNLSHEVHLEALEKALSVVVSHHDALRLRFRNTEHGWEQAYGDRDQAFMLYVEDLSAFTGEALSKALHATIAWHQTCIDLTEGPLMRAVIFQCGAVRRPMLLLTVHHLVIDTISWGILLEDLQTVYLQYSKQKPVQLPPKITSFKRWAEALVDLAVSDRLQQEKAYWLARPVTTTFLLPRDEVIGENTTASVYTLSVTLDEDDTKSLLQEVPSVYQTQINEVLLAALVLGFAKWTGQNSLLLGQEGHGREAISEDLDLSRTIGWFTSFFPVLLSVPNLSEPGEALVAVKEQVRQIPGRGIGYGVLRYLSQDTQLIAGLQALPEPEVLFNYLGRMDHLSESGQLFQPLQPLSLSYSTRQQRSHVLEINAAIEQGCLIMRWSYSTHLHRRDTIERVAQDTVEALRTLIAHCLSPEAGRFTPSDFPESGLDQATLDRFLDRFS